MITISAKTLHIKPRYNILWASTHIGGTFGKGAWFQEGSWEEAGFVTDDSGNPTHDPDLNRVAGFASEPFDPCNEDHTKYAIEFTTQDSCDQSDVDWLVSIGVDPNNTQLKGLE